MRRKKRTLYGIEHIPRYSLILIKALRTPLLLFFAAAGNVLLLISALIFFRVERTTNAQVEHFFDALWWAFSTVSTVGYGDITPVTFEGRIIGIFLMITGVIFFVGFTGIFVSVISALSAEVIVKGEEMTYHEYQNMTQKLQKISDKIDALEKKVEEKR